MSKKKSFSKKLRPSKLISSFVGSVLLFSGLVAGLILVLQPQLFNPHAETLTTGYIPLEFCESGPKECSYVKLSGYQNTCKDGGNLKQAYCCPLGKVISPDGKSCVPKTVYICTEDCTLKYGNNGLRMYCDTTTGDCKSTTTDYNQRCDVNNYKCAEGSLVNSTNRCAMPSGQMGGCCPKGSKIVQNACVPIDVKECTTNVCTNSPVIGRPVNGTSACYTVDKLMVKHTTFCCPNSSTRIERLPGEYYQTCNNL